MPPRIPPQERDWPTLPIPPFAVQDMLWVLAQLDWESGMPAFKIRDRGGLEATLAQPYQAVYGRQLYPTVSGKAACLFRGFAKNHVLVDGNKRLAVTATTTFLLMNGRNPRFSNAALLRYALRVARTEGEYDLWLIESWLRRNTVPFDAAALRRRRAANLRFYSSGSPVERWFVRVNPA